jgi:hypothetical protein
MRLVEVGTGTARAIRIRGVAGVLAVNNRITGPTAIGIQFGEWGHRRVPRHT